jgi:periplasmic protein TonB
MSAQTKGWQLSLVIHGLLIFSLVGLSRSVVRINKPLKIDFTLESSSYARPEPRQKTVPVEKGPVPITRPMEKTVQPVVRYQERPMEQPVSSSISEGQSSVPSTPVVTAQKGEGVGVGMGGPVKPTKVFSASSAAGKGEVGTSSPGNPPIDPAGAGNEKAKYLKDHFAYIKDLVQKCVSYPRMAKKMGWEGKVVVAFTVLADGTARDVKVIQSCGIDILNTSAVEAVKKACPFPKPPAEAQIVLPVVYKLT